MNAFYNVRVKSDIRKIRQICLRGDFNVSMGYRNFRIEEESGFPEPHLEFRSMNKLVDIFISKIIIHNFNNLILRQKLVQ